MSSLVLNQDGRPEMFVIGRDRAIWHKWTDSTGTWGNWESRGGKWKQFTVATNQDGRLEVFAIGIDDIIRNTWQTTPNGSWSAWASRGGKGKQIAVVANQDGRLELFAIDIDDIIRNTWQTTPNGSWSAWASRGGKWNQLLVSRQPNGTLQLIALGVDNETYQTSQISPGGSWKGWQRVFMGSFEGDFLAENSSSAEGVARTENLEFRLDKDSVPLARVALTTSSLSMATIKSTEELKKECVKEMAEAMVTFAGVYAMNQQRLAGAGGAGVGVAIVAGIVLSSIQINSAVNKCAQAIQQTLEDDDSENSESPDKGVSGMEGGSYWDYVPSTSEQGIMVA